MIIFILKELLSRVVVVLDIIERVISQLEDVTICLAEIEARGEQPI